VDTHQESIEHLDCLELRTDTVVVVVAHARVVIVVQVAAPGARDRNRS